MSLFVFLKGPIKSWQWSDLCNSMYNTALRSLESEVRKFPYGKSRLAVEGGSYSKTQKRISFFKSNFRYSFLGISIVCASCGKLFNPAWKATDLWSRHDLTQQRIGGGRIVLCHDAAYSWARIVLLNPQGDILISCGLDCAKTIERELEKRWEELSQFKEVLFEAKQLLWSSRQSQRRLHGKV